MKITIHHTEVGRYAHIAATTGQEIDLPPGRWITHSAKFAHAR